MNQKDQAMFDMIQWLSHPSELGRRPARIELTGSFDYLDMKYYVFKFRKGLLNSKWLLGVCGGYENDDLTHCGHVFSDYSEYHQPTEVEDACRIVEMIRQYWIQRANEFESQG